MTDAKPQIYEARYVSFIDILGFSEIVRNSVQSPTQASELAKALDQINSNISFLSLKGLTSDDFRAQSFSDCILLSEAPTPKGLQFLLTTICFLTNSLLSIGILTRGGLSKGLLHHSDKAVFGPAFLSAYEMENQTAIFPRIIVDRETLKDYSALDDIGDAFIVHGNCAYPR